MFFNQTVVLALIMIVVLFIDKFDKILVQQIETLKEKEKERENFLQNNSINTNDDEGGYVTMVP